MSNEMEIAALLYLGEWLDTDLPCRLALSRRQTGAKALQDFATAYGVHRTLRRVDGEPRLERAYDALMQVGKPAGRDEAIDAVCRYADQLKEHYGTTAQSAATKFAWLRFGHPIRIYDSLARRYLKDFDPSMSTNDDVRKWYPSYYDTWERAYDLSKDAVAAASMKLNVRSYLTESSSTADQELRNWIGERWFQERVFDRFMIMSQTNREQ